MVGVIGFEPTTPSPPAKCATKLRHTPTKVEHYIDLFKNIHFYLRISVKRRLRVDFTNNTCEISHMCFIIYAVCNHIILLGLAKSNLVFR